MCLEPLIECLTVRSHHQEAKFICHLASDPPPHVILRNALTRESIFSSFTLHCHTPAVRGHTSNSALSERNE